MATDWMYSQKTRVQPRYSFNFEEGIIMEFGVRREEEEEEEKKGRLIMKVFQIAAPWRSGAWRGFRGFGLSTIDLMPGMEYGSQSHGSLPISPRLPLLLLPSHSWTPPTPPDIPSPTCPQSSQLWPRLTSGTTPLPLSPVLNTFLVLFSSLCLVLLSARASSSPLKQQGPLLISL